MTFTIIRCVALTLIFSNFTAIALADDLDWKVYSISESGFSVALPTAPQGRSVEMEDRSGTIKVYEAYEFSSPPSKYSIFVGKPDSRGIYEPASMDAYLVGHLASMIATAEKGELLFSRRIIFRGHPALVYKFSHQIEGHQYNARGVTLMVDGDHMRISMLYPVNANNGEAKFKRFVDSFHLTPISYTAAHSQFIDPRGIDFTPPLGWIKQPLQNKFQVARFSNLTRSIQLMIADRPTYTCDNFQNELQGTGYLKSTSNVQLNGKSFKKLTSFEVVPKYNVRLTVVQYCINSQVGAVVLGGHEEESMFSRWEQVFEGAAASVRVR